MMRQPKRIYRLLLVAVACLLLGYLLRLWLFDPPFRSLLWDESLLRLRLEAGGIVWSDWVAASGGGNRWSDYLSGFVGLLLAGGLLALIPQKKQRSQTLGLFGAAFAILFLVLLQTKENFWRWGYFIEHALQIGAPIVFWCFLRQACSRHLHRIIRWLTALTFIGHGLYAVGYYPVPQHFLWMFIEGLAHAGASVSESAGRVALKIVGSLDFLAALLLLLPQQRLQKIGLLWILPWALLTTLARWWSYAGTASLEQLLLFWTPEVLLRLPHLLLPLCLWWWEDAVLEKSLPMDMR